MIDFTAVCKCGFSRQQEYPTTYIHFGAVISRERESREEVMTESTSAPQHAQNQQSHSKLHLSNDEGIQHLYQLQGHHNTDYVVG